ncbi:MAG: hypothetical protein F4X89_09695, partial [Dehalococcoidia bacterium]|nr:hypothetical protein [Dehalococcoidia bacterium]
MPETVECARHAGVETALRCSRCESPICPSCLIQSPVGARCPDCARVVRAPMYVLSGQTMLRAGLAAVVGGVVMGLLWRLILLPFTAGFFSLLVGVALGYAFTRLLEFATGGKRGPGMVGFAVSGIVLAWGVLVALGGAPYALWGVVG